MINGRRISISTPRKLFTTHRDVKRMKDYKFVEVLKDCAKNKDLLKGSRLHETVLKMGLLQRSPYVASTLINMYAKCGVLSKARDVLDLLPVRDVFCWSALIAGYVQHGKYHEALKCHEQMQTEDVDPDDVTFISILKACGNARDIEKGEEIHHNISNKGLIMKNVVLGNALVDMYAKCGMLAKAQQVFDELLARDVVSWSALIAGYAQHNQGHSALHCYERMQKEGFIPNEITFCSVLKACGTVGAADIGNQVHDDIIRKGLLTKNTFIGNVLVDMYAKCGMLRKARQVLEELSIREIVSWNSLIGGYAEQGEGHEALRCFQTLQKEGLSPGSITLLCALKACGSTRSVDKVKQIHTQILSRQLLVEHVAIGNALVDIYGKCNMLVKAQKVFYELPIRNIISWSSLIAGCNQQGQGDLALQYFERMRSEGISPDEVTFGSILKACSSGKALDKGKYIHEEISATGMLDKDIALGTSLVDMYTKCDMLANAQKLFDELPVRDVTTWSALISGYVQQGRGHEALNFFECMQNEGVSPNVATFVCVLKACGSVRDIDKGKQIHDVIVCSDILNGNVVLGNALVDMYAKCGMLTKARQVLLELPTRTTMSWSILIAGYAEHGQGHDALNCFEEMCKEGLSPDSVTLTSMLKSCGLTGDINKGKEIHEEIVKRGLLENNVVLGNALVDFYAKCGMLAKSEEVLKELHIRNVSSWSSLISGYVQQGQDKEALKTFKKMRTEGLLPDAITFVSVLKACGGIGVFGDGVQIHEDTVNTDLLSNSVELGNALVYAFAKCGMLTKAQEIFDKIPLRDIVSWSTLIGGYAKQGEGHKALNCFEQMLMEGISPDPVTILCVLNACSHSGLIKEARTHFGNMNKQYGIMPSLEHYICMVDVLGYAGHFDDAMSIIENMPCSDNPIIWLVVLNACKKWGNVKMGRLAFVRAVKLDNNNAVYYSLMADIYAAAGMPEDAEKVKILRMNE